MFHVDAYGTLNDLHDSLLWYPVPRGGIPGINECVSRIHYVSCGSFSYLPLRKSKITVINYTGAARDYLKKLIQVMGAKFTPSMSRSNKVFIAG
jgi:hypothetical protein